MEIAAIAAGLLILAVAFLISTARLPEDDLAEF